MNNSQCAHLWANKSRTSGKGSNLFFDGETIFSYGHHFPIARHHKGVVLFTRDSYSVTTSKHCSQVRSAISHLTIFYSADVTKDPCKADVKAYADSIQASALSIARARSISDFSLQSHQNLINEANSFCERFKFKTRFSMPENFDELRAKAKLDAAKKAVQTKKRNEAKAKEEALSITMWINGELNSLPYSVNKVFLRKIHHTDNSGNLKYEMQTSKGALVPLADAEKAFRFVTLKRSTGWKRNGEQFPIGEFHLDAVNEFGVVAGCHRIEWSEIERFAKTQGWIENTLPVS
jgi:hypothetical protein